MSLWDSIFGRTPQPGSPGGPPRQLTLPRLMNLLVNPFAVTGSIADFQKDVYQYKQYGQIPILRNGFQHPFPIWIGCSLSLGAFKTARGLFPIPANFYLLNYFASTDSNANGGFKVVVYDSNRRIAMTDRPINFNTLAGQGSAPLFQRVPYPMNVNGGEVKVKWTITSLESVATNVEFGLYGIQVSDTDPKTPIEQRVTQALHP
jgi:hypothetical protein